MSRKQIWVSHGNDDSPQYDFEPPSNWSPEQLARERASVLSAIESVDDNSTHPMPGWLVLLMRLPAALRSALVAELRAGNCIEGVGSHDWPNEGSIVVNVSKRFSVSRHKVFPGVTWNRMNDPHYWREDLSQEVDSITHLIIT